MEEAPAPEGAGTCEKRGRFWAVTDAAGRLVCLAVYRKGGREVLRRLALADDRSKAGTGTTGKIMTQKTGAAERQDQGERG